MCDFTGYFLIVSVLSLVAGTIAITLHSLGFDLPTLAALFFINSLTLLLLELLCRIFKIFKKKGGDN